MLNLKTFNLDAQYDYIIIGCGYVKRLISDIIRLEKTYKRVNNNDSTFLFINMYDDPIFLNKDVDKVYDTFLSIKDSLEGHFNESICIIGDADDAVNDLRNLRHCACWKDKPIYVASFTTPSGKTVLYEHYDTESG